MKCITCESWSWTIICKSCQNNLLTPHIYKRSLQNNFHVYSFYTTEELEELLLSKYYFHGDKVLSILAKKSFAHFATTFTYSQKVMAIAIDDVVRQNFSHTAILLKHLKSDFIHPCYNQLKAQSSVKYAGKDLDFRKNNPRNFILKGIHNQKVILVDDVITSGTTLLEAKKILEKNNNQVLFALTLATKHYK